MEAKEIWQEGVEKTSKLSGVKASKKKLEGYPLTKVEILNRQGEAALGKPQGAYLTIDLTTFWQRKADFFERAVRAVGSQLKTLLPEKGPVLIIGLGNSLINLLHGNLVSAIGLGAIAVCGSDLELLDGGLQLGLCGLVTCVTNLTDLNALLGRLNIRQTKHLLVAFFFTRHPPCRIVF